MRKAAGMAVVLAALGIAEAAAGAAPSVTLTVGVSGNGVVTSRPAGINCRPACTLRVRKGATVTLTASPNSGAEFSHWSAPCGSSSVCTLKLVGARVVHAFFKAGAAPPPPPPPAKPGNYAGTYTDGTYVQFTVSSDGTSLSTFAFDNNGECQDGSTSYGNLYADGPFTIQSDGSFSGTGNLTLPNGTVTINVAGHVSSSGAANGTLNVTLAFSDGTNCTSKGTWLAQDQS